MLNIAAYLFVDLNDLPTLRETLHQRAAAAGLKGTVLLAPEGINLFLAGDAAAVRGWLEWLRQDARFAALQAKESVSDDIPFRYLRVKIKNEIIRMNQPNLRPSLQRAPAVDAPTLARWLEQGFCDAGRPVLMLDTRNAWEVDQGTFESALDWRLQKFSDFPAALAANRQALEGKTIVSYCTGGIRCEKAALLMREQGVEHVLQLDGGILKYFEATEGAPHWQGRCVVFDERGALDTQLNA